MSEAAKPASAACASCKQPLQGRYCSQCGEEVLDPRTLTVRYFITHTLLRETLDLDGKIWRTLRHLVSQPAFLTAEYCEGRRRLYVSPLRLLITAIIVYALLTQGGLQASLFLGPLTLSIAPAAVPKGASVAETVNRIDRFGLLGSVVAARNESGELNSDAAREKFHSRLEKFAQPLSFANVFMLALALHALFRRRRRLFIQHLVFSMHFLSLVLFSSLVFVPLPWLDAAGWRAIVLTVILAGVVYQFAYLTAAIRRFYFGRLRGAVAAALLIYVLNSAFITAVQLLGGVLALRSL